MVDAKFRSNQNIRKFPSASEICK